MVSVDAFIKRHVIRRQESLFQADIEANWSRLKEEIDGKSVCVIGGAGSIGSSFIREILKFHPGSLMVVDINENGLVELTRDLRSRYQLYIPSDYRTYTLDFSDRIFKRIFREEKGFDIVANFSAHKHVRSEKDKYSVQALIENNVLKSRQLMDLLCEYPPEHFFCVSTDKAANPVNIMGASKRIMEDVVFSYNDRFRVSTARFANVAFSNGSLPDSWLRRIERRQPLIAPIDVRRFFVSPEESGQICLLSCILGRGREVFFPKLKDSQMLTFKDICDDYLRSLGYEAVVFEDDDKAREYAASMPEFTDKWPVVYSKSDTTGEKMFEEFYVQGEKINMDRFSSLGVIEDIPVRQKEEIISLMDRLESVFMESDYSKRDVVVVLKSYLLNFQHDEKGKNLDERM